MIIKKIEQNVLAISDESNLRVAVIHEDGLEKFEYDITQVKVTAQLYVRTNNDEVIWTFEGPALATGQHSKDLENKLEEALKLGKEILGFPEGSYITHRSKPVVVKPPAVVIVTLDNPKYNQDILDKIRQVARNVLSIQNINIELDIDADLKFKDDGTTTSTTEGKKLRFIAVAKPGYIIWLMRGTVLTESISKSLEEKVIEILKIDPTRPMPENPDLKAQGSFLKKISRPAPTSLSIVTSNLAAYNLEILAKLKLADLAILGLEDTDLSLSIDQSILDSNALTSSQATKLKNKKKEIIRERKANKSAVVTTH